MSNRVGVEGTYTVLTSTLAFYSSRLCSYNETQDLIVGPGQVKPYAVGL
jgi:hypothetical protein